MYSIYVCMWLIKILLVYRMFLLFLCCVYLEQLVQLSNGSQHKHCLQGPPLINCVDWLGFLLFLENNAFLVYIIEHFLTLRSQVPICHIFFGGGEGGVCGEINRLSSIISLPTKYRIAVLYTHAHTHSHTSSRTHTHVCLYIYTS